MCQLTRHISEPVCGIVDATTRGKAEPRAPTRVSSRGDQTLETLVILASGIAIAFLLAQIVDFGFGRDQGIYAAVARSIFEGGAPYRDAWDFKPPGIYFVYLLGWILSGPSQYGVRLIEIASLLTMVWAFALLSQRYIGTWKAGVIGAALAIVTHAQLEFWHTAQPESFAGPLVAWGMVASAAAAARSASRDAGGAVRWFCSGVLYGCAALLKPTLGVACVGSLGACLWTHRHEVSNRGARAAAALIWTGAGGMVAVGSCVLFFYLRGGLAELQWTLLQFAPQYTSLGWRGANALDVAVRLVRGWLFMYAPLNALGLVLLYFGGGARFRSGALHASLVVLTLLPGIALQAKFFPYHFATVLAMTSLLAGWGLWSVWERIRHHNVRAFAMLGIVALILALHSATTDVGGSFSQRCRLRVASWSQSADRQKIRDLLYSVNDYSARDNRLAAEWLRRETSPAATVFVWGFSPEIYVASERQSATRYIYNVPQRAGWSSERTRRELMQELLASRPEAILVEHGDVFPWVTGTSNDSAAELPQFAELATLVRDHYRLAQSSDKFDVYQRVAARQ
jgi:hypothetical protein